MDDIIWNSVFIAWLIIGIWGWWIMYNKIAINRGQRIYMVLAFVFLVPFGLATFVAALINPKQKECSYCKSSIDDKAKVCPKCGRDQIK